MPIRVIATFEQRSDVLAKADQITSGLTLCCRAVTRDHRCNERCVPGFDKGGQITGSEGHPDKEVASVPEGLPDPHTQGRAREVVQHFIAATISLPQLDEASIGFTWKARCRRQGGAPAFELFRFDDRAALGGQAGDDALGGSEQFIEVLHFGRNRTDHAAANLGQDFQKSLDRKAADRIRDRRATYRKDPAHSFGRNLVSGIQPPLSSRPLR